MVVLADDFFTDPARADQLIAALNLERPLWPTSLPRAVVWWTTEDQATELLRGAPDYFDWRSGAFSFGSVEPHDYVGLENTIWNGGDDGTLPEPVRRRRVAELQQRVATNRGASDRATVQIVAQWELELANHHRFLGELDVATVVCGAVLERPADVARPATVIAALGLRGLIEWERGNLASAERTFEEVLGRVRGKEVAAAAEVSTLGNLAGIALQRGHLRAAKRRFTEVLRMEKELGRPEGQANAMGNLGIIEQREGRLIEATRLYNYARDIANKIGRRDLYASMTGNLAVVELARGNVETAKRLFDASLRMHRELGQLRPQAITLTSLGIVATQQGRTEDASALLAESRDLYVRMNDARSADRVRAAIARLGSTTNA